MRSAIAPSRIVPQRFCQLQQDAHSMKQERLQRSLETVPCVGTGSPYGNRQLVPKLWASHRKGWLLRHVDTVSK